MGERLEPPDCPICRSDERVTKVDHPAGRWWCPECDLVFQGGGIEALALAGQRDAHQQRHKRPGRIGTGSVRTSIAWARAKLANASNLREDD